MKSVTLKLQMSLQRWNCEETETLQTAQNLLINHILSTNLEIIEYAQTHLKKLQEFILPDVSYYQFECKKKQHTELAKSQPPSNSQQLTSNSPKYASN